ncbi:DUF4384 domain-containing protein [Thermodesulfobacteriota bacterium]
MTRSRTILPAFLGILLIMVLPALSEAESDQQGEWIRAKAVAPVEEYDYEKASIAARQEAKSRAVERACGVEIDLIKNVQDLLLQEETFLNVLSGTVQEIRQEKIEYIKEGLVCLYSARMRVACEPEEPDPAFRLSTTINKTSFSAGEEVIVKVGTTRDCYLHIFQIGSDNRVMVALPNHTQNENFLDTWSVLEVPSAEYRVFGHKLTADLVPGKAQGQGLIWIIATKQEVPFLEGLEAPVEIESPYKIIPELSKGLRAIRKWALDIPRQGRTGVMIRYEVHRSSGGRP